MLEQARTDLPEHPPATDCEEPDKPPWTAPAAVPTPGMPQPTQFFDDYHYVEPEFRSGYRLAAPRGGLHS